MPCQTVRVALNLLVIFKVQRHSFARRHGYLFGDSSQLEHAFRNGIERMAGRQPIVHPDVWTEEHIIGDGVKKTNASD